MYSPKLNQRLGCVDLNEKDPQQIVLTFSEHQIAQRLRPTKAKTMYGHGHFSKAAGKVGLLATCRRYDVGESCSPARQRNVLGLSSWSRCEQKDGNLLG